MISRSTDLNLVCAIAVTALLACGGAMESSDTEVGGATGIGAATSGGATQGSGGTSNGGATVAAGGASAGGASAGSATGSAATGNVGAATAAGGSTGSAATGNVGAATAAGGSTGSAATGNTGAVTALGGNAASGGTTVGVGGACSAPTCGANYFQSVTYASCDLSTPVACYTVTGCGLSVTCFSGYTGCGRATIGDGRYTLADVTKCRAWDGACPTATQRFDNECGCGCAQPVTCPPFVDCMPSSETLDPLCTDPVNCPYTTRVM